VSQPSRLRIELRPSPSLATVLAGGHLLAAASALALPVPLWSRLGLLVLIGVSAAASLKRHALRSSPGACTALEVHRDGSAQWSLRSGAVLDGRLLGESFVSPLLTVVRLRRDDNGRREAVVLLPDSAEADALRALRVWLRFKVEVR
jgi:toxin CptA